MVKLTSRTSGFFKLLAMGRTRPKLVGLAGTNGAMALAGGAFGKNFNTAGFWVVAVKRFLPSKISESRTTVRYASWVISANDAPMTGFSALPNSRSITPFSQIGLHATSE